jgi:hypothetical protein
MSSAPTIRELTFKYKSLFVILFTAELIGGIVLCAINYDRYEVLITVIAAVLSYKIIATYREYNTAITRYNDGMIILNSIIFIFITIYYILVNHLDFLLYMIIEIVLLCDLFIQVAIVHIMLLCSIIPESVEGAPAIV